MPVKSIVRVILLPTLMVILWSILSTYQIVNPVALPNPEAVIKEFWTLLFNTQLLEHISTSLIRVLMGYSIGSLIGIVLGIFMGLSPRIERMLNMPAAMQRNIPPVAWIPLAILWFGLGTAPAVFIIMLATIPPVLINTIVGVRETKIVLYKAAMTLGIKPNSLTMFSRITFPAAFPFILNGLRIGIGSAWTGIVAAEMIAAKSGLGYMLVWGQETLQTPQIILALLLIGGIGYLFDRGLAKITAKLAFWKAMEV